MTDKIMKKLLPLFYLFCLICFFVCGFLFYRTKIEQRNRLIKINDKVDIRNIGDKIELELNDNSQEEIIYQIEDENIVVIKDNILVGISEGSTKVTVSNKDDTKNQVFIVNVGKDAINEYKEKELNSSSNNATIPNNSTNNSTNSVDNSPSDKNNNSSSIKDSYYNPDSNYDNSISDNNYDGNDSSNNSSTPSNKNISVSSISLNKSSAEIYLNSKNKNLSLDATIYPNNANNKEIIWSSSNKDVAIVNNGTVTAISPGTTTISAKSVDGNKVASMTLAVKKKVIIVIGASQVTRMSWYKRDYFSTNYVYDTDDGSLVYINKNGSGIDYQTNEGWITAKKIINSYSSVKNQINFYIFFPLSGNSIKNFACNEITSTNNSIKEYAKNYNNAIKSLKDLGYNVKGNVVSMHPVKVSQSSSSYVVTNENDNSCKTEYRSNRKYYKFNKTIKSIIESKYNTNLNYESLFVQIMNVNNEGKNFSYKIAYNTDDGIHWDSDTTKKYVNMMFDYTNDL